MSTRAPADEQGSSQPAPAGGGWYGWVVFAATMLILLGIFHAIAGLVALFDDDYFLVGKNGLTVHLDYTSWGWTHLILGAVVAAAGLQRRMERLASDRPRRPAHVLHEERRWLDHRT